MRSSLLQLALAAAVLPLMAVPPQESSNAARLPKHLQWLVLKPIPIAPAGSEDVPDEEDQQKAFTSDLLAAQGGESQIRPRPGDTCTIRGAELKWEAAEPDKEIISFSSATHLFGLTLVRGSNYAVAYASTEFEVPVDTQACLGIGSDDGARVWLNGVLIHDHWAARALALDEDIVPVRLRAGKNHLLLKVQNITSEWGFACRFVGGEETAKAMIAAVKTDDLASIQKMIERGVDINSRTREGLTPWLAARLWGQREMAEFLEKKGADTKLPMPTPEGLVDALISERFDKDSPGAAVLVARNGKILLEKTYGLADLKKHLPLSLDTPFCLASISKQFTAAGILRLQEAGKLRLTDPLSTYYPGFPRGSEVTLYHLLTHTSGLPSPLSMREVSKPTSVSEIINYAKKTPFDFNPGEKFLYSNAGYYLLGDIIEKVSGQEYGDYLKTTFFMPLGMTATGVRQEGQMPESAATGYEYENGAFKKASKWDYSYSGGAGSLYSTLKDLYLWNEAIFNGWVLNAESQSKAFAPVITQENRSAGSADGYGCGWVMSHLRSARKISHSGANPGFRADLLRLPEYGLTVIVLENQLPGKAMTEPTVISDEIAQFYLGSQLGLADQAKSLSQASLQAIVGRYDFKRMLLSITQEGGSIYAQSDFQPRVEIFPKSDTDFFSKDQRLHISFVKEASGRATTAVLHSSLVLYGPWIEEKPEITLDEAQIAPLLGEYQGHFSVICKGNRLYAFQKGAPRVELVPTSSTDFYLRNVAARVTFVKDADGKVTKAILHLGGKDQEGRKLK